MRKLGPLAREPRSSVDDEDGAGDPVAAGRLGKPEDIGQMITFLASPGGDWITGAIFVVDGGSWLPGERTQLPQ